MTSQIITLFSVADKNGDATLTWKEIVESLADPSTAKEWKSIGVQAEDARYLFKLLDLENCGEVPFEEFMGGALRLSGQAKAIDLLTVMQEARKNEEKLARRHTAVSGALVDLHETVHELSESLEGLSSNLDDVASDVNVISSGMQNHASDLSNLSYMLGLEFTALKNMLRPLQLLEELMVLDAPANV